MGAGFSLGIDIGSISTKGVVLDESGAVKASAYRMTAGSPLDSVRKLLETLRCEMASDMEIHAVGTTGSARRLIGAMVGADAMKNEITAHAVGTLSRHPEVRTILEIGGQDAKIILIREGVVTDYAMNTLCAAGTGAFLSSQAGRLGMSVEEMGEIALQSKTPTRLAARCTVFAESDLIHKAQVGHRREDLVAGLCGAVAANYLGNVGKGKQITSPVIFQGGVSLNAGVVAAFQRELACDILVDTEGPLMGAIGAALLARDVSERGSPFCFDLAVCDYQTRATDCGDCANHCEIISFYRDGDLLDAWGARCGRGHS